MWQPIETAPRDGTGILLWDELFAHSIGYYGPYPEHMRDDVEGDEGWHDGVYPIVADGSEPTHWMPLPEPPTTKAKGGE